MARLWAATLLALVLAFAWPAAAAALWGDSDGAAGLGGSWRNVVALVDNYNLPLLYGSHGQDLFAQGIARFTLAGRPGRYSYQVHLVATGTYSSAGGGAGSLFGRAGAGTRYRALDLSRDWLDDNYASGQIWLDRANLKTAFSWGDLTVGRQAISFGKAYFWNPLDVFLPFDARQFDRDYKPGVDALRLDLPLGMFSGLTMVLAPGRGLSALGEPLDDDSAAADWTGSAFLLRAFALVREVDLAAQAGKVYGGWQAGAAAVGDLAGWQWRGEAAWFWPQSQADLPLPFQGPAQKGGLTAALGLGRRWPSSLDLEMEYLFNGPGDPDHPASALARVRAGSALQMGRHLLGANLSFEPGPLSKLSLVLIYSLSDGSAQVQPLFGYSLGDNSEMLAGAAFNRGKRPGQASGLANSEFGSYPDYFFLEFKFYF